MREKPSIEESLEIYQSGISPAIDKSDRVLEKLLPIEELL